MSRAPFQVLVLPWCRTGDGPIRYALFQRADSGAWQGIAGGGEDDESPTAAAVREAAEEGGFAEGAVFTPLKSLGTVGVEHFRDRHLWDPALRVIPEYTFGVAVESEVLVLSHEHRAVVWLGVAEALERLEWESNRAALRELDDLLTSSGEGVGAGREADS